LNGEGFIVGGGVSVVFAAREHAEEGAQDFVADGDDGALVAAADDKGLELRLEHGLGTTGGLSELAEYAADIRIALAGAAGYALAGRLVAARTDADPGGQAIGAAEGRHIGTDFDQQHGGTDQIDAGNGLQQCQRVALGFEFSQQSGTSATKRRVTAALPTESERRPKVRSGRILLKNSTR